MTDWELRIGDWGFFTISVISRLYPQKKPLALKIRNPQSQFPNSFAIFLLRQFPP
jgi:hypothetical protein